MQMDDKTIATDLDGQQNPAVRKPYQSPVLKRMGAIQEVLQSGGGGLGGDTAYSNS